MRRILSFAVAFAAAFLPAGTASAVWDPPEQCVGTSGTIVICSDPNGAVYYSDCVYTGGSSCQQMTVYGPTLECSGRYGSICYVSVE